MKKTYDLAFGLGMACSCSQTLRKAGMQFLSFPYDWLTLSEITAEAFAGDAVRRAQEVAHGFPHWFEKADFRFVTNVAGTDRALYTVDRLGLLLNHDFHVSKPFDEECVAVCAKYRRRADRLLAAIRVSKNVLVLRVDRPDFDFATSDEDLLAAHDVLNAAFSGVSFDLVHFAMEKGRSFRARRVTTLAPGVMRVCFDYKDYVRPAESFLIDTALAAKALSSLARVRDYRTPEEKARFAAEQERKKLQRRAARYAKFGAENWLDYQFRRLFAKRS